MKNFLYILLAVMTLGVSSCEKEIEFKGETTDPIVVVNCMIEADSVIKLDVSLSNFFLDNKNHFDTIKNAEVKLFINNQLKEKLNYFEGFVDTKTNYVTYRRLKTGYFSTFKPTTGDSIKITVKVAGYDEITAVTQVVQDAKVVGITSSMDISQGGSYDIQVPDSTGKMITIGRNYSGYLHVKLRIDDPADVQNFYRLIVNTPYGSTNFEHDDPVFGEGTDQSFFEFSSYNQYGIFNDELFNGNVKELNFSIWRNKTEIFDEYKDKYKGSYYEQQEEYTVDLQQISREAYWYLKTSSDAISNQGNPFSEPVQIFSNIKGGLGVLGTYNKLDTVVIIP